MSLAASPGCASACRSSRANSIASRLVPYRRRTASSKCAHIDAIAERGRPDVSPLVKRDEDIAFSHERVQVSVYNTHTPAIGFASQPNMLGLLAWTFRDQLIKKLDAEIDAASDDTAMSHAAWEKAEAETLSEALASSAKRRCSSGGRKKQACPSSTVPTVPGW